MTLKRSVLAWSVQAVLCSRTITVISHGKSINQSAPLNQQRGKAEQKTVVYREYFIRLLNHAKPLRDQLIIELPILEAFRTGEVSSLRVEWVDFDSGDIQVLDSKKHTMFTVPLDPVVAEHLADYVQCLDLTKGIVIQPLPTAHHTGRKQGSKTKGAGLSNTHIEKIWAKWCRLAGIPVLHPREGRAYWAVKEHFVLGKSIYYIMAVLRHDSLQSTEHYLSRLIDYETVKATFHQGKKSPFTPECASGEKCPLAISGCYCRSFTPTLKVKA